MVKRFTQQDLDSFAAFTGDYNHIHSTATPPEQRRVHGALLNAVVAGIMGTQLPGPGTVVLSQQFSFPNACRVDVDTKISVRLVKERKISLAEYECRQGDTVVLQGVAKLLVKQ